MTDYAQGPGNPPQHGNGSPAPHSGYPPHEAARWVAADEPAHANGHTGQGGRPAQGQNPNPIPESAPMVPTPGPQGPPHGPAAHLHGPMHAAHPYPQHAGPYPHPMPPGYPTYATAGQIHAQSPMMVPHASGHPHAPMPYAPGYVPVQTWQPQPGQQHYGIAPYYAQVPPGVPINLVVQNNIMPQATGVAGLARVHNREKLVAALLAFIVGGFGVHRFYLGRIGSGILFLLFFWTGIPAIVAFIEAILLLMQNPQEFDLRYNYRLTPPP